MKYMGKLSIDRVLYRIRSSSSSGLGLIRNFSFNNNNNNNNNRKKKNQVSSNEIVEYKPLIGSSSTSGHLVNKLKDVTPAGGPLSLAIHTKPKEVVLKVSMHCNGCARQVRKHVLKMEGVIACKVDMETKTVVVTGDIIPLQVVESLSKVKTAQLWYATQTDSLDPY